MGALLTTGRSDYSVRVAAKDQADLIKIVDDLRDECAVVETYTRVILREFVTFCE